MIEARWDFTDVEKGINAMSRRAVNMRPVLSALRVDLKADIKDHFDKKQGPFGAWAPLAQSTVKRILDGNGGRKRTLQRAGRGRVRVSVPRRRIRRKIQNLLGRLKYPGAVAYSAGRDYLEGRSRWSKSSVHQDGEGRNPKREHLWISPKMLDAAREKILTYCVEAF